MLARRLLLTLVLATGAPAPAQDVESIPFGELGAALLAAADARRLGDPITEGVDAEVLFLRRIEPLHQRIRLGAIELWVPTEAIGCTAKPEVGLTAADVAPIAKAVIKLQRSWVELAELDGGDSARSKRAFTRIENWANSLPAPRLADVTPELATDCAWLSACFRRDPTGSSSRSAEHPYGIVMLFAPKRAHYLSVLGAAGLLDERYREWFWDDSGRRSGGTALYRRSCLIPFTYGPHSETGPWCENHTIVASELVQLAAHQLSHVVTSNVARMSPAWFAEGLALFDTIRATGADETLCTGFRETVETMVPFAGGNSGRGPAGMLLWVTRDASPYRDGASPKFFLKELAAAFDAKRGFAILDLETSKVAQFEKGPFLGALAVVPPSIESAQNGVKKGFAEFFRAYCAAFVDHLFETKVEKRRLLQLVLVELKSRTFDASQNAPDDLLDALEKWTKKSLDAAGGTDTVERGFVDWLSKRR